MPKKNMSDRSQFNCTYGDRSLEMYKEKHAKYKAHLAAGEEDQAHWISCEYGAVIEPTVLNLTLEKELCAWVEPNGTVHQVFFGAHETYLVVVLGKELHEVEGTWVRINKQYPNMKDKVQFCGRKLTRKQQTALDVMGLYWEGELK